MPELPEAETIARGIRPGVVGRTIRSVRVHRPDVLREPPSAFSASVTGARLEGVERRGKNIILRTGGGAVIAVNLGMTGRLLTLAPGAGPPQIARHPAVHFHFDTGASLLFDDTRRFGTVEALSGTAWQERSARMGPEPLGPHYRARDLAEALAGSRAPVRSWLLDQRRIAGVGNIYANEALYLAGIDPRCPAFQVDPSGAARLHRHLRRVLRDAIEAGGTTIRDYRSAEGQHGQYAPKLWVYGRDGEPCLRCGSAVERLVFGGRSAFRCPRCQPLPPAAGESVA